MVAGRTTRVVTLALLAIIAGKAAADYEIYHWLDENGVPNFSQKQPDRKTPGISILNLADTTPPDYDPGEDRYGVREQAQRMNALREEMKQRRDASRERQRNAARQQVVQYREPVRYYSHPIRHSPILSRKPHKPQAPVVVPDPTSTLEPFKNTHP